MIKYMKMVLHQGELNSDERNLLNVAYRNSISSRRAAWRTITAIQTKEALKGSKFMPLI